MKKITKNNKGFSLIELIIVIAIMAVLVAIIAPNLTKYLGSSKTQTDNKNLDEVEAQVKNCISDASTNDITVPVGSFTLTTNATAGGNVTCSDTTSFGTLVSNALGDINTKSKVDPSKTTIQVTIGGSATAGYTVSAAFN